VATALALALALPLAAMFAMTCLNLLTAPRLSDFARPARTPRVSVLVPARNEGPRLPDTLPRLLASDYPDFEILVLDDESSDDTAAVVERFARLHPDRLRLLRGRPLPRGWTGKAWACDQLAAAAAGEILVFCDADVSVSPAALPRTIAALTAAHVDIVTALPAQRLHGAAASAVVPLVMHVAIAATLPLAWLPRLRGRSTFVVNGQWFALRVALYRRLGGHAAVRPDIVEDMAIGRRARRHGARVLAVVAERDIATTMYRSVAELRAGFDKNLYALAGGTPTAFALALTLLLLTMAAPVVLPLAGPWPVALLPLALLVAIRVAVAALFRHGALPVLLHPAGVALLAWIGIRSAASARSGTVVWKGRLHRLEKNA
jgi:chlorobactene glucosyltransferase